MTTTPTHTTYRLLRAGTLLVADVLGRFRRVEHGAEAFWGGLLQGALGVREREELTLALYARRTRDEGDEAELALWGWERAWFARRLPPPPSRILVGGAGEGREAAALARQGYRVDAFEPAPGHAAGARRKPGMPPLVQAGYAELCSAVLGGANNALCDVAATRYDAILLGWGSLAHLLGAAQRMRLLQACDRLCPQGPILASAWLDPRAPAQATMGRGRRLGLKLGRRIAQARGLPEPDTPLYFALRHGFAERLDPAEMEELGRAAGRRVLWEPDARFPHFTWVRESERKPSPRPIPRSTSTSVDW